MTKKVEIQEIDPVEPAKLDSIAEKPASHQDIPIIHKRHWSVGRIFWGLFLVLIGLLALASNYELATINWFNLWRLWPLFIVLIGLSLLTVRGWANRLLVMAFIVLVLGAITYAVLLPQDTHPAAIYNQTSSRLAAATQGNVNIKVMLGRLDINTSDQLAVAQAHLESNIASLTTNTSLNGSTQTTDISTDVTGDWSPSNTNNNLNVNLTRSLPIALSLDIGAADVSADLSLAHVRSLDIRGGATRSDIKLGDPEDLTIVNLNSGASSFIIRVPSSSGVSVKLDGVTSNNLSGLEKNGDTYQSANFSTAIKKVTIVGHLGLASFTLERY